jgi:hypothetical protein
MVIQGTVTATGENPLDFRHNPRHPQYRQNSINSLILVTGLSQIYFQYISFAPLLLFLRAAAQLNSTHKVFSSTVKTLVKVKFFKEFL